MLSLALSFAPIALAVQPPQDESRPAAVLETRRFALPFVREPGPPVAVQLVPYGRIGVNDFRGPREEPDALTADAVAELVRRAIAPESWNEPSTSLAVDAESSLVVRAERARISEAAALLTYLSDALLQAHDLVVEVYPIVDATARIDAPSALVAAATAEQLLARWRSSGAIEEPRRWTLRAFPTRWARAGGQRSVDFVRDLDVEICDGAAIPDPWIDCYRLGTVAHVHAIAASGGSRLHLFFEHGEVLGGDGAKVLSCYREHLGDDGELNRSAVEFPTRQPVIGFGTLALDVYVPEGRELVLVQRVSCPQGSLGHVLRVKPLAARGVPRLLELGAAAVAVRDVAALTAARFTRNARLSPELLAPHRGTGTWQDEAPGADLVEPARHDTGQMLEQIEERFGDEELALGAYGEILILSGTKANVDAALRWLDELVAPAIRVHDLHLELRDRAGSATLAEISLATSDDSDAYFSMGSDALAVNDIDVEIASRSTVTDPAIDGAAHGLMGRVRAQALGERVVVDLELALHWMSADPEHVPIAAWEGAVLDLCDGVFLRLAEPFVLGAGESAETGDLDPSGTDGLVLRITRRG